jgi:subtilisin family serine protease
MLFSIALFSLLPLVALGAPILNTRESKPGKYIVVLQPDVKSTVSIFGDLVDEGTLSSIKEHHFYDHGDFKGFTASLDAKHLASLQADPRVAYLEADGSANIVGFQSKKEKRAVEGDATWGLGRISHRDNGSRDYLYDSTGAGTCAYTIDTGVSADHPDFQGRAQQVMSYTGVGYDDNGHGINIGFFPFMNLVANNSSGTHVAGIIGSATYGVAKQTMIYAVKVLDADGNGAWSDIISGLQFAVSDSVGRYCPNGVVINMSLGGGKSQSVDDAVAATVNAGFFGKSYQRYT